MFLEIGKIGKKNVSRVGSKGNLFQMLWCEGFFSLISQTL